MNWFEALILGLIQGLSEFLPVSSSGHLELGKVLLGIEAEKSLIFTVVVHGATVLSTLVVFYNDIIKLFKGALAFKWNTETKYILNIALSMIPVLIVGLFFEEQVELLFTGNLVLVGSMLLFTALLLSFTYFSKGNTKTISSGNAFVIGLAQALAVIPGISRSGSTIATGLLLGNKKEEVSRFSFLMVLIPIIGANIMGLKDAELSGSTGVGIEVLVVGFIAAFISGLLACKWMIKIVNKGKLIWFSVYVAVVGLIALFSGLFA